MDKIITKIIRIILSLILVGLIYKEAGAWTSLFAFLVMLRMELEDLKIKLKQDG